MIDVVALKLLAGNGGHGRVSFRREKYIPKGGPDGGNGGRGGNIVLRVNAKLGTLQHLAGVKTIQANDGANGGKRNQFGHDGEDVVIEVPPGTVVWLAEENKASQRRRWRTTLQYYLARGDVRFEKYYLEKEGELIPSREGDALAPAEMLPVDETPVEHAHPQGIWLAELTEDSPDLILCQGGYGGRGNDAFKGSAKTTPLEAEYGTFGEQKRVVLELRLLADIGLVGFPNAGKSTLLSVLTNAKPKIANYPFTTLEPNLGIMNQQNSAGTTTTSLVMADIPGLIEGAHEGKGLGHTFLKHLEHCQALLFVVSLEDAELLDEALTAERHAEILWERYQTLRQELSTYASAFLTKKHLLIINKIDMYSAKTLEAIRSLFTAKSETPLMISGYTGEHLDELKNRLWEVVQK